MTLAVGTLVDVDVAGMMHRTPVLGFRAGCVRLDVGGVETYALPATVEGPTLVLFRVYNKTADDEGGDVIAVFPEIPESNGCVSSYVHNGQHGACSRGVVDVTRPATPEEYAPLKRELEAEPYRYNLKVGKRWPSRG